MQYIVLKSSYYCVGGDIQMLISSLEQNYYLTIACCSSRSRIGGLWILALPILFLSLWFPLTSLVSVNLVSK